MESDEKIAEMRRILTEELPDDNYFIVKYVVYFLTEVTFIGADFRFEVPGQSSVRLIGGGRGQWLGGTMASAEHEPIMGVWGQSPWSGGRSPPEAESILVTGCPTEPANLAPLVKFSK